MLSEQQTQRLKELEEKEGDFTEEERQEWVRLHEDQDNEAIEPITEEQKLQPLKDELLKLEMERKRLELELNIRAEKRRIEKARQELDGKIWCPVHEMYVNNSDHFKELIYCDECRKDMPHSHFQ